MLGLGAYTFRRPIGRGGMCEVWAGVDRRTGSDVAIKVMLGSRVQTPMFQQAFQGEVRAVAGLRHPSIVQIYDVGQLSEDIETSTSSLVRGSPYLVMELADSPLTPYCGRLTWQTCRQILLSLLDALAHAHARGVIHRDIKPGNILLQGTQNQIKLADFGLAHLVEPEALPDAAYAYMGTPSYMAPEQFEGRWRDYGPWTDLYELGCTVYSLLLGRPPYGRTKEMSTIMRAHMFKPVPPLPSELAVPQGFHAWLQKMLAKEPSQRFQRASDAALALLQLDAASPTEESLDERDAPLPTGSWGGESGDATLPFAASDEARKPPAFLAEWQAQTFLSAFVGQEVMDQALEEALDGRATSSPLADAEPETETSFGPQVSGVTPQSSEGLAQALVPLSYRQRLSGEWSVPPQLLLDDWRGLSASEAALPGARMGLSLFHLRAFPVVGQAQVRDQLWHNLREVCSLREPRFVMLRGAQGVGKTRILEWLTTLAHEIGAAHVLKANHATIPGSTHGLQAMISRHLRCVGLSYKECVERLSKMWSSTGEEEHEAMAALLAPLARAPAETEDETFVPGTPRERYSLLLRLVQRRCEQRAVVLWLDDVHWGADALAFVEYLLEHTQHKRLPLLVCCSASDEELTIQPTCQRLLKRLSTPPVESIHLGALSASATQEMLEQHLGLAPSLARELQLRSMGNPSFALQLVGDWIQRGVLLYSDEGYTLAPGVALPGDLHGLWVAQLERLLVERAPEDRDALELAALLDAEVEVGEWAAVCAEAGVALSPDVLGRLCDAAFAVPGEDGRWQRWSFAHGQLRKTLVRIAHEEGRAHLWHSACARSLAAQVEGHHADVHQLRIAHHWLAAAEALADVLADAASPNTSQALEEERGQALDRALSLFLEAAHKRLRVDDFHVATGLLDQAEGIIETLQLPKEDPAHGECRLGRAQVENHQGTYASADQMLALLAQDAEAYGWDELLVRVLLQRSYWGFHRDKTQRVMSEWLPQAHQRALLLGDGLLLIQALNYWGEFLCWQGEIKRAKSYVQESLERAETIEHIRWIGNNLYSLASINRQEGEIEQARMRFAAARYSYARCGYRRGVALCANSLGELARQSGEVDDALAHYRDAMKQFDAMGEIRLVMVCRLNLALGLLEQRSFAMAQALLEESRDDFRARGDDVFALHAEWALLCCHTQSGELMKWQTCVEAIEAGLAATGLVDVDFARNATLAGSLAVECGDFAQAVKAYELALAQWEALQRGGEAEEAREALQAAKARWQRP